MVPVTTDTRGRQSTNTPSPQRSRPRSSSQDPDRIPSILKVQNDLNLPDTGVTDTLSSEGGQNSINASSNEKAATRKLRDNYTLTSNNQTYSTDFERSTTGDSPGDSLLNNRNTSLSNSKLTLTESGKDVYSTGNYILGETDESESSDHGLVLTSRHTGPLNETSFSEDSAAYGQESGIDNAQNNNGTNYLLQDEYIPGLNYNDIIKKWEKESSSELLQGITAGDNNSHKRNVPSINNSYNYKRISQTNLFKKIHKQKNDDSQKSSSLQLSKYPTWESVDDDDLGESSGSNDVYGFDSAAKKGEPLEITKKNQISTSTPFAYNLTDSHAQVEPIPLPSFRTSVTPPSAIEMKRRVSYPGVYNKNVPNDTNTPESGKNDDNNNADILNRKGTTPRGTSIMDNSLNNLKSSLSPLKLRTQPSTAALANQLTSLRRNGSISIQRRTSIDEVSVSSSYSQLPRDLDDLPLAKRDEINKLILSLPEDFLSHSYSQRKKIVINLLSPEDEHHYKLIMTLAKKYLLNSSRSSISIMNNSVPQNSGFQIGKDKQPPSSAKLTRHNSIASQYLSSFSPLLAMPSNLPNKQPGQRSVSFSYQNSSTGTVTRPGGEGTQLFNYTIGKEIGYGAFGVIYDCQNNETGEGKAAKVILFKGEDDTEQQAVREIGIWQNLSHPCILPLLKYKHEEGFAMYALTEKINDGNLYDLVIPWGPWDGVSVSPEQRCKYTVELAYQMIEALKYMHSKNIVHGDIKLENCLVDKLGDDGKEKLRAYLCDFGMSHDLVKDNPNRPDAPRNIGSLPYASPELLLDNTLGFESDAWAFGVLLYIMLVGKFPFRHGSVAKERELIQTGHYDTESLEYVSKEKKYSALKDIIGGCLEVDISKRWSIAKIDQVLTKLY